MKTDYCQQNMPFELGSSQLGFERLFVSVFVKSKVTIYQPLHSYIKLSITKELQILRVGFVSSCFFPTNLKM